MSLQIKETHQVPCVQLKTNPLLNTVVQLLSINFKNYQREKTNYLQIDDN